MWEAQRRVVWGSWGVYGIYWGFIPVISFILAVRGKSVNDAIWKWGKIVFSGEIFVFNGESLLSSAEGGEKYGVCQALWF